MTKPVNVVRFYSSLDGKTINTFIKQINFSDKKTQKERIDKINQVLYTEEVNNPEVEELFIDKYFALYFDHWYKVNPNVTYPLSEDHDICRKLSRMASYILYAHDTERITKKTEYNFYSSEEFWKKINKEQSTDEIAQNKNNDKIGVDVVIDFLVRKNRNFKKQIKQKILSKDLKKVHLLRSNGKKHYLLKDYQKGIDFLGQQLKKGITQYTVWDSLEKRNQTIDIKSMRNSMIDDQILSKDKLNGTIYFKNILPESTEVHWDMFDFFDKDHVMALLRIAPRKDSMTELDSLIGDLECLLDKCDLSPTDLEILNLYRKDLTIGDIAKRLEIEPHIVSGALNRICNKVIDAYEDRYEDWYYLNIVKGKYKNCSKCGEIKFANERHFWKRPDSKDGFHNTCIKCSKST